LIKEKAFEYALKIFIVVSTLFYLPAPPNMPGPQQVEFGYLIQELFFRYGIVVLFCLGSMLKPTTSQLSFSYRKPAAFAPRRTGTIS